jgi:hypothetical protein
VGANCVVLEETGQKVSISAFTDAHRTFTKVPIVTAATAYDDKVAGTTYILILGQSIYMADTMNFTLLCLNQMRKNGIIVNDCPKHLAPPNSQSTHSLICSEEDQEIHIKLHLNGVTSFFETRIPTETEIKTCKWIFLTNDTSWDPHSNEFQAQEKSFYNIQYRDRNPHDRNIYSIQTLQEGALETDHGLKRFDDRNIINL